MPAALALDGHNWMFPLAFGFFGSETKENWVWFMEQLRKAIGPMNKLAICTDACKGLESAVKIVFPEAEMRECFRHLMENMKKYFTGDVFVKNMWPAARAYSAHKYKYFFDKVLEASPDVQKWLNEHHPFLWARSKFRDDIKCDYITNNLAGILGSKSTRTFLCI
jgi:transposase-like protein